MFSPLRKNREVRLNGRRAFVESSAMSSIARDRIRRCLAMIPLIRARPGIRIPELASIFGVREEEIWEDITEVLSMCGIPPYLPHNYFVFQIQGDRVSIRFAEHLARPVHLTLQEALAIDLALRAISGGRPPAFGDAAPRLRQTLRKLLGHKDREALERFDRSVGGRAVNDEVTDTISALKDAMSRNVCVEIEYYTASRDSVSTRVIEPYGLIDHRGNWYAIARDQRRDAEIPFRVDRIRQVTLVPGSEYEVRDDFTTESWRRDAMWVEKPGDLEVKVRFAARVAARAREEAGRKDLKELPGGDVVRTYRIDADRPRWLLTHVARFGEDAEILSPPRVREEMAAFLGEVLGVYGRSSPSRQRPGREGESSSEGRTTATAAAQARPRPPRTARKPRR